MNVEHFRSDPDYADARCTVNRLCRFDTLLSNEEVVKEICRFCKKEVRWPLVRGKMNNVAYGRAHIRDIIQPHTQAYDEIYGIAYKKIRAKEQQQLANKWGTQDYINNARDMALTFNRLEAQGKL
jgi:hypothetical protein